MTADGQAVAIPLTVNGRELETRTGATVASLVAEIVGEARMVAVERNGEIVARSHWAETPLRAGDRIELVRFVQGG